MYVNGMIQYREIASGIFHEPLTHLPNETAYIRIDGYLQSYKYFAHVRHRLRTHEYARAGVHVMVL